jgi:hypothetical protein
VHHRWRRLARNANNCTLTMRSINRTKISPEAKVRNQDPGT